MVRERCGMITATNMLEIAERIAHEKNVLDICYKILAAVGDGRKEYVLTYGATSYDIKKMDDAVLVAKTLEQRGFEFTHFPNFWV